MRNRKGFTLVELIVVLVIVAILAAVLVVSLTGYLRRAKESTAVTECRSAVQAAQSIASEQVGLGSFTIAGMQSQKQAALDLAGLTGQIRQYTFSLSTATVQTLTYLTAAGVCVYYDHAGDPQYQLLEGVATNAVSSLASAQGLSWSGSGSTATKTLQSAYLSANGGFTPITADEQSILAQGTTATANAALSLTWKPLVTAAGDVILMATPSSSDAATDGTGKPQVSRQAYLLYYNGAYYYHFNGYSTADAANVTDAGFDAAKLDSAPAAADLTSLTRGPSTWVRVP